MLLPPKRDLNAGFFDDKDRINAEERFKRLSPETVITVI
jgi:adenine-specific DNA-methyltransferase